MNKITTHPIFSRILSATLVFCFLFSVATDSSMWQEVFESENLELSEQQSEDKTENEKEVDEDFPFDIAICTAISEKNNNILMTHAKAFYAGEMRKILTQPPEFL